MEWTEKHRRRIHGELRDAYASGDWYSEVGTQFNKRMVGAEEIVRTLGLDERKRTGVIFPHILWDGTFFWGTDLFGSYEKWLVETVRAACKNEAVNWLVKIHPANVVKNLRDGVSGAPAEVTAIQRAIGEMPPHVRCIPAESSLSTYSLFSVMDVCVTVRGTVGLEAALFGRTVLTAGTGRYNGRGFTLDSATREEYLARIDRLQDLPAPTLAQRELAERYAYGVFVARPLRLQTVSLEYQQDRQATLHSRINVRGPEEWVRAPDLLAFAAWVKDGRQVDFLDRSLLRGSPFDPSRDSDRA